MQRLSKQYYYKKDGTKGVNCYKVNISKELAEQVNFKEHDKLNVYAKGNKIIIEKTEVK